MRILCVDDDGLILSITADLLRELGHDVVEAAGGDVALSKLYACEPFDVLVTDIHMPGGPGGRDLAEAARETQPGMAVIYFSGIDQMSPAKAGDLVLRKPCTLGELQRAIGQAGERTASVARA